MTAAAHPTVYAVAPAGGGTPYLAVLTGGQAAGDACVRCRATGVATTPYGRCWPPGPALFPVDGVQVFACDCEEVPR